MQELNPMRDRIVRLERFCAALYRALPIEGRGLLAQADELAHAADLEDEAARLELEVEAEDAGPVLTPADIHTACQLLIDVRRDPHARMPEEVVLARRHFPEVEADSLDPLEDLIGFYTTLLDPMSDI